MRPPYEKVEGRASPRLPANHAARSRTRFNASGLMPRDSQRARRRAHWSAFSDLQLREISSIFGMFFAFLWKGLKGNTRKKCCEARPLQWSGFVFLHTRGGEYQHSGFAAHASARTVKNALGC